MAKSIFIFFVWLDFVLAGAVCEYKIAKAKEGVQSYENYKKKDERKLAQAKAQLESLLKSCDDEAVLKEVEKYIATTKQALQQAEQNLRNAMQSNDAHQIAKAQLERKIARTQYIAARQEQLRLKDLLKSNR